MPISLIFQKYFVGFSYGVSFPLTIVILDYWLKDCGVTNSTIGIFSILHLPFALKLFLAPVIDEFDVPILSKVLGRRRSWVVLSQLSLIFGILCMSMTHPESNLIWTMFFASFVALADGMQNIALYPYQISEVEQRQFGYAAGIVSFGHRMGGIITKCMTLYCAQFWGWKAAYQCAALLIFVSLVAAMIMKEPKIKDYPKSEEGTSNDKSEAMDRLKGFRHIALVKKLHIFSTVFEEIKQKWHTKDGICTILVVLLYKSADFAIQKMSRAFCLDIGFTKVEIANIVQFWGSIAVVFGGFLAGYVIKWIGILRAMMLVSIVHLIVLFAYVLLNKLGHNTSALSLVIFFEGISGGAVTAAFIAFLYDKCKNGSQYALLWAMHEMGGMIFRIASGFLVDLAGWNLFFIITPLLSIPGIAVLQKMIYLERIEVSKI